MSDMRHPDPAIRLDPRDNVLVARRALPAGSRLRAEGIAVAEDVPPAHKLVARRIAAGEPVLRGGVAIGVAVVPLDAGRRLRAAAAGLRRPARDPGGVLAGRQHRPRFRQEGTTRGGQRHRMAGALEQPHPQLPLQHLNLPAERRLGHVQALGGATEVELLGEGDKGAEVGRIQHRRARPRQSKISIAEMLS